MHILHYTVHLIILVILLLEELNGLFILTQPTYSSGSYIPDISISVHAATERSCDVSPDLKTPTSWQWKVKTPEEGHRHQIQDGDLLVSVLPSECFTLLLNYLRRRSTPEVSN